MKLSEIKFIKEGGAAAKQWGVGRVNKGDIAATIKYVSKIAGIPVKDLHPLGSVGKSPTSGDIDLAVDLNKHDMSAVHDKVMQHVDDEGVLNKGTKIGSYAIPIQGNTGKVQVDLMFVDNVDWASFAYYSAGADSKFKGVIRTLLLIGVASAMNEPGTDHFEYDDGELIIRAGRTMDLTKGMRRIFQHRPKKKSGEGYLKTMKSVPVDEFKKMFPDVKISGDNVIIDDPKTVVQILFGEGTKVSDVRTAEQVLKLIKKFDKKKQREILSNTKRRAKTLGNKMKLPEELS